MKKTDYLVINIVFASAMFVLASSFLMQDMQTFGSIAWWIKKCQPHFSLSFFGVALLPFYIALILFSSSTAGFYLGRFVQRKRAALFRSILRVSTVKLK